MYMGLTTMYTRCTQVGTFTKPHIGTPGFRVFANWAHLLGRGEDTGSHVDTGVDTDVDTGCHLNPGKSQDRDRGRRFHRVRGVETSSS